MATAYTNSGGSGNRNPPIVVTTDLAVNSYIQSLVNGNYTSTNTYFSGGAVSGKYLRFDFIESVVVDEATLYQTTGTHNHGTFQWQGSNNGSDWTNIGNAAVFGGTSPAAQTALNGNTTAYRYYQLLGVSGSTSNAPYIFQMNFKIANNSSGYYTPIGLGDRTSVITVTADIGYSGTLSALVNGAAYPSSAIYWTSAAVADKYLKFDLADDYIVTEVVYLQGGTTTHGTYKWQGSNDNSNWADIGSSFALGGAVTQTITALSANTTSYRYYRILGVSGSNSFLIYVDEFIFKTTAPEPEGTIIPLVMHHIKLMRE